jgi:hypothetical protein
VDDLSFEKKKILIKGNYNNQGFDLAIGCPIPNFFSHKQLQELENHLKIYEYFVTQSNGLWSLIKEKNQWILKINFPQEFCGLWENIHQNHHKERTVL